MKLDYDNDTKINKDRTPFMVTMMIESSSRTDEYGEEYRSAVQKMLTEIKKEISGRPDIDVGLTFYGSVAKQVWSLRDRNAAGFSTEFVHMGGKADFPKAWKDTRRQLRAAQNIYRAGGVMTYMPVIFLICAPCSESDMSIEMKFTINIIRNEMLAQQLIVIPVKAAEGDDYFHKQLSARAVRGQIPVLSSWNCDVLAENLMREMDDISKSTLEIKWRKRKS